MQVLSLIPFDETYREKLRLLTGERCQLVFGTSSDSREDYLEKLRTAQIILGDPDPADLQYCEALQWMQTTWAGVSQYVACGYLKEGMLCNMTGGYGPVIGEMMASAILTLAYRFPAYQKFQQQSFWHAPLIAATLEGATVLILGAGDIGTELAKRLRPFGCRIIGVRRVPREFPACFDEMITLDDLAAYLPEADVVACCLPDTPHTRGLLNLDTLKSMKKDANLVNMGRGSLIVTDDLCQLLEQGHFHGVCLDVTDPEPLPPDHPLWKFDRVIITPHVAGNGAGPGSPTECRIWDLVLDNLQRYLTGQPCRNIVDFSSGYRKLESGG